MIETIMITLSCFLILNNFIFNFFVYSPPKYTFRIPPRQKQDSKTAGTPQNLCCQQTIVNEISNVVY